MCYPCGMSSATFDTLKYAKRLEAGGFDTKQAEALAEAQKSAMSEALDTQLATKGDIVRLDGRINLIHCPPATHKQCWCCVSAYLWSFVN